MMKIFLIIVYILAVLFTYHQATYCGWSAGCCARTAEEYDFWYKWYVIFGGAFLFLFFSPIIWGIVRGIKKLCRYLNKTKS